MFGIVSDIVKKLKLPMMIYDTFFIEYVGS